MRIQPKHIPDIASFLNAEFSKGNKWLAVMENVVAMRLMALNPFRYKVQAEEFIKENTDRVYSYALVPLAPLHRIIQNINKLQSSGELRHFDTHVELDKILQNYEAALLNSKTKNMIQENLKFLQENVKYMGFADATLSDKIAKNMQQGVSEFALKTAATFNNKNVEAELSFRKSDKSDMYFFNRYTADLKSENNNPGRSQTFYIDNGKGITFKEAFNLLEGRAVNKELTNKDQQKYQAWVQLDFDKTDKHNNFEMKRFTDGYGYDLAATVKAFPIKELDKEDDAKKLMSSLQKGNVQSVTMKKNGTPEKMFIEASPQWKTVNLYDGQMKLLNKDQKQGLVASQEGPVEKQAAKQDNTQGSKQNKPPKDESLLQKKRTSHKKGLAVT